MPAVRPLLAALAGAAVLAAAATPAVAVSAPASLPAASAGVVAPAASAVGFGTIQYDPSGADTRTARQLNREWVTVRNTGGKAVSLRGWTVRDAQHHRYTFGAFTLRAHAKVLVHTGSGRNTAANRYWGSGNFIWNNGGDTATLTTKAGKVADRCRWTHDGAGTTGC